MAHRKRRLLLVEDVPSGVRRSAETSQPPAAEHCAVRPHCVLANSPIRCVKTAQRRSEVTGEAGGTALPRSGSAKRPMPHRAAMETMLDMSTEPTIVDPADRRSRDLGVVLLEGAIEIVGLPSQGHSLTIENGSREVADTALTILRRSAEGGPPPAQARSRTITRKGVVGALPALRCGRRSHRCPRDRSRHDLEEPRPPEERSWGATLLTAAERGRRNRRTIDAVA